MAEDKKLVFGVGSITEPTPKFAKTIFRVTSFIVGLWAILQHMNLGVTPEITAKINEWCIAVVPIMHFTIKFFRWDYTPEN